MVKDENGDDNMQDILAQDLLKRVNMIQGGGLTRSISPQIMNLNANMSQISMAGEMQSGSTIKPSFSSRENEVQTTQESSHY